MIFVQMCKNGKISAWRQISEQKCSAGTKVELLTIGLGFLPSFTFKQEIEVTDVFSFELVFQLLSCQNHKSWLLQRKKGMVRKGEKAKAWGRREIHAYKSIRTSVFMENANTSKSWELHPACK